MAMFSFACAADDAACASMSGGAIAAATAGPGWYDSSWDLRRGLLVREGLPRDAQLHEWLEQHLRSEPANAGP